jgi:hypothetical protein
MMKAAKEPPNMEEAAAQYAEIAEKAGISVTKEAIQELLEEKEKVQQAATAKAESAVKEALDPEDLDQVAGGKDPRCADSFNRGEWCWFTDSCSYVINSYSDQSYAKVTEEIIGGEEWTVIDDCKLTQMGINMSSCGQPAYDIRGTVPGE